MEVPALSWGWDREGRSGESRDTKGKSVREWGLYSFESFALHLFSYARDSSSSGSFSNFSENDIPVLDLLQ